MMGSWPCLNLQKGNKQMELSYQKIAMCAALHITSIDMAAEKVDVHSTECCTEVRHMPVKRKELKKTDAKCTWEGIGNMKKKKKEKRIDVLSYTRVHQLQLQACGKGLGQMQGRTKTEEEVEKGKEEEAERKLWER
jgi:hypothetical protein